MSNYFVFVLAFRYKSLQKYSFSILSKEKYFCLNNLNSKNNEKSTDFKMMLIFFFSGSNFSIRSLHVDDSKLVLVGTFKRPLFNFINNLLKMMQQ